MTEIALSLQVRSAAHALDGSSKKLIELARFSFEPGYWQQMCQPALLVLLRFTQVEISATAVSHFDAILESVHSVHGSDDAISLTDATLPVHLVLGRLLRMTLGILHQMGMPVAGGANVLRPDAQNPRQWVVGLPAVSAGNNAPRDALALACGLMNDLAKGRTVKADVVRGEVSKLIQRFRPLAPLGVNTLRFLEAAHEMGIPWCHVANNVYQFGWGRRARWLDSSFTDETSTISASLARDKVACAKVLRAAGLPVPRHQLVASADQAIKVAEALGYPVVVKPANLDGGFGVRACVRDADAVQQAFDATFKLSKRVLVEQFIVGNDYRVRVCKGEVIGALIRRAAAVLGDGVSTVQALIDRTNSARRKRKANLDPQVEQGYAPITIDDEVHQWLAAQGLDLHGVVPAGQRVRLRGAANVNLGGTNWDVTRQAHPDNLALAVQAAAALRLDVAGVDLLLPDIARSWQETGGAICEVNAQPQFSSGQAHREVLRLLVKGQGRIPVIAITGISTNADLEQTVVQCFLQEGVRIHWVTTPVKCLQALRRSDVDGLVWQMQAAPSPNMALPVDQLSLWIRQCGSELGQGSGSFRQVEAIWDLDESSAPERLADRLIAFLRGQIGSSDKGKSDGATKSSHDLGGG